MKRKYKLYISLSIFIIVLSIIFIYKNNYNKEVLDNKDNVKTTDKLSGIAIMLETSAGSGKYNISTTGTFPKSGYEFNKLKSGCENGGTLSYNEETRKVTLKSNISDKCYIYFDLVPPDVSVAVNNLPTMYGKLGNITCENSNTTYNQQYNRIEVSQINGKYSSCTLNYSDSTSKVNFADYIISLAGTTQGTGQVINEKGYRYEGKEPNNYVWFNNEYWRIIGVFDSASHGISGKNLVKMIRADILDALAWEEKNINDWTVASLNLLLNGAYYNAKDGTNSGYCYGDASISSTCDYTKKGIQSGYRKMIANVTWYLGGYSNNKVTTEEFYGYERGTEVVSGRPTYTTGYIGLMYPSDYGYSVLSNGCARTTKLNSYNSNKCAGQSWLYGKGYEWTLTPDSVDSSRVFFLVIIGGVYSNYGAHNAFCGFGVRPVLYLEDFVYKMDGDGSLENPYIIGM